MRNLIIIISLILALNLSATIINVPAEQPTIQSGIDISVASDTILVQPGTYAENINYNGKAVILGSLFLTTQDTIYISQTVIDGSQNGNVVAFESGEDSTAILSGFTIENGDIGISCFNSSPIIQNCLIQNYYDYTDAMLIHGEYSSPIIKENRFVHNYTGIKISFSQATTIIVNNLFLNNLNDGIFVDGSSSVIENNEFNSNEKGVFIWEGDVLLRENLFINSTLAGVSCYTSSVIIEYNIFDNNPLNGIYCSSGNELFHHTTIRKNLITNSTRGILCHLWDGIKIINNSIIGNQYGIVESSSEIFIINNIIDGIINDFDFYLYSPPPIVAYSCTSEALPVHSIDGGGNIVSNPLFVDPENGNFNLLESSPCIDAGTAFWEWDGNIIVNLEENEYFGIAPDMGCYEGQYVNVNECEIEKTTVNINNYPNPFNPETNIVFDLSFSSNVLIEIYNIKGQKVTTLINDPFEAGSHKVTWNAVGQSSGIYLLRFNTAETSEMKKLILLK